MAHIPYSRGSQFGAMTAKIANDLITAQNNLTRIKTMMDELTAGGTVLSNLETGDGALYFGVAAGQGANFYNNIVSIKTALANVTAVSLGDFDQGPV